MESDADNVLSALRNAYRSDARKGGHDLLGLRSSVDLAEMSGLTTAKAAKALNTLYERGDADFYGKIEGLGNVHYWQLAEKLHAENHPDGAVLPSL